MIDGALTVMACQPVRCIRPRELPTTHLAEKSGYETDGELFVSETVRFTSELSEILSLHNPIFHLSQGQPGWESEASPHGGPPYQQRDALLPLTFSTEEVERIVLHMTKSMALCGDWSGGMFVAESANQRIVIGIIIVVVVVVVVVV